MNPAMLPFPRNQQHLVNYFVSFSLRNSTLVIMASAANRKGPAGCASSSLAHPAGHPCPYAVFTIRLGTTQTPLSMTSTLSISLRNRPTGKFSAFGSQWQPEALPPGCCASGSRFPSVPCGAPCRSKPCGSPCCPAGWST